MHARAVHHVHVELQLKNFTGDARAFVNNLNASKSTLVGDFCELSCACMELQYRGRPYAQILTSGSLKQSFRIAQWQT